MKTYTSVEAAKELGVTRIEYNRKIRLRQIDAKKLNPHAITGPAITTAEALEEYKKHPVLRGGQRKRCEPCKHKRKKVCASCGLSQCENDYRKTRHGSPAARCKDCENERKKETRKTDNGK